ncbi:MAG: hypothetical protein MK008_08110 [Bdellovibrionales bacterium]|nr:hypothetical protein [Bdellovibrionales bacterium]
MKFILIVSIFIQFITANAQAYSFLESYLDAEAYKEFQNEQRLIEKTCGHIESTYFQFYGERLESCEFIEINGHQLVIAKGAHGELSKAELQWLGHALNLQRSKHKINFIMGDHLVRENLVPQSSFAIQVEFLF